MRIADRLDVGTGLMHDFQDLFVDPGPEFSRLLQIFPGRGRHIIPRRIVAHDAEIVLFLAAREDEGLAPGEFPDEGAVRHDGVLLREAVFRRDDGQLAAAELVGAGLALLGAPPGYRVHRPVGIHVHGRIGRHVGLFADPDLLGGGELQGVGDGHRACVGDEFLQDRRPFAFLQDRVLTHDRLG